MSFCSSISFQHRYLANCAASALAQSVFARARQHDDKPRHGVVRLSVDIAAMHINDRLDDGQPETGPFISVLPGWITAVEAIEELWQLLCWNLLTGVLDTDGGRAQVLVQPHCDNVPARRVADCVGE